MRAASSLAIIWKANRNHTQGHSSLLATWSETQRQLVEPRGDRGPAFPARSCIIHLCTLASALRGGAGGGGQAGREKSAVAMETAAREEPGLCAGWGWEGHAVSAWKQPRGLCTCTTLCNEEPQEARGQEVQQQPEEKKKAQCK